MSVAAITPRVRILAVCDEVLPSEIESEVFTLEGVRQHVTATAFPHHCRLCVFLLLSSARKGTFSGKILVVDENHDQRRTLRYVRHPVTFHEDNERLGEIVVIENLVFPQAGEYAFEVRFELRDGGEALKGEYPFQVFQSEE